MNELLLKKVRKEAIDLGFKPLFAQEFEWFNFRENSEDINDAGFHNPTPITRCMFGYSIIRASRNREFINDMHLNSSNISSFVDCCFSYGRIQIFKDHPFNKLGLT